MNYRHDTRMLPEPHLLRVCLSCWRRVPTVFSRQIQHHRYPGANQAVCSGTCGRQWTRQLASQSRKEEEEDIAKNPFFEKYQKKLQHMQKTQPEEFQAKVSEMIEKKKVVPEEPKAPEHKLTKPEIPGHQGPISWPPKSLDEIMKVELLEDLEAKQIEVIWNERHLSRDCVFAVVKAPEYEEMITKSRLSQTFLFPLPKNDGFEFYLCQFSGKDVYFTPLGMYQLLKENAPPCLSIAHFPELKDSKGIVLMAGEYDSKLLSKKEALILVRQMAMYYGRESGERYRLVRLFSSAPDQFDYMDLVDVYKQNKHTLEDMPY